MTRTRCTCGLCPDSPDLCLMCGLSPDRCACDPEVARRRTLAQQIARHNWRAELDGDQ